jgi:uncharacterized SAM-binding protein YcdF (DUF218 family)
MDFSQIASSAAQIMLMPPTSLLLLILLGYLLRRKWPGVGAATSMLGVLLLLLASTNAGALLLVAPLEAKTAPLTSFKGTGAEAIVVLGAGIIERAPEYEGQDAPDQVALARLHYAAYLQHATGLPILTSGGFAPSSRTDVPMAASMARVLREDFKTPVKWTEERSRTTAENAVHSAAMLKEAGIKRVMLVTHAMHMPRAQEAFARAGIEVVAAPTVFHSRVKWSAWMLLPSASGLSRSYYASHEWVGLAWYRMKASEQAP